MNQQQAIEIVDTFLALMAKRELAKAKEYLADGFTMTFPPSAVYYRIEDLVQAARGRYQWCDKVRDRWDVCVRDDASVVVYSLGTLFGVNVAGVKFEGIRYVDRFVLRDGKISEQDVWNDLAESGVLSKTPETAGAA